MKENPEQNDPQLSRLLQAWQVDEPLPPRFQEHVWKRIESAESGRAVSSDPGLLNWLTTLFARPAFATAFATLLLVAGLTAGFVRANRDAARMDTELAHRYVVSLNPYASPTH
jgi:hypothetical protein